MSYWCVLCRKDTSHSSLNFCVAISKCQILDGWFAECSAVTHACLVKTSVAQLVDKHSILTVQMDQEG